MAVSTGGQPLSTGLSGPVETPYTTIGVSATTLYASVVVVEADKGTVLLGQIDILPTTAATNDDSATYGTSAEAANNPTPSDTVVYAGYQSLSLDRYNQLIGRMCTFPLANYNTAVLDSGGCCNAIVNFTPSNKSIPASGCCDIYDNLFFTLAAPQCYTRGSANVANMYATEADNPAYDAAVATLNALEAERLTVGESEELEALIEAQILVVNALPQFIYTYTRARVREERYQTYLFKVLAPAPNPDYSGTSFSIQAAPQAQIGQSFSDCKDQRWKRSFHQLEFAPTRPGAGMGTAGGARHGY